MFCFEVRLCSLPTTCLFLLPSIDCSQAWRELSPLPWAQGASGAVGHVYSRCHPALHQGVMSTGGCTCHVLQTSKGHESRAKLSISLSFMSSGLNLAFVAHSIFRNWLIDISEIRNYFGWFNLFQLIFNLQPFQVYFFPLIKILSHSR